MAHCEDCGRWIAATEWRDHEANHELQLMLDHTGPHGSCNRTKVAPHCSCPDPVLAHPGSYVCTCCQGVLSNLVQDTWEPA